MGHPGETKRGAVCPAGHLEAKTEWKSGWGCTVSTQRVRREPQVLERVAQGTAEVRTASSLRRAGLTRPLEIGNAQPPIASARHLFQDTGPFSA